MRDVLPNPFRDLAPSEGYRGMAIGLSTLCSFLYDGICSKEIEQVLEALHQSLQTSLSFPAVTMLRGGSCSWALQRVGPYPRGSGR